MKVCECGCGLPTPISKQTRNDIGHKRGEPIRYISGHNLNWKEKNPAWKGGVYVSQNRVFSYSGKYKHTQESILVCEAVLGKHIPSGAIIHHVDGDSLNNKKENLIICQDKAYHNRLHRRMRAKEFCGNASWLKCPYCKQYDDPKNMNSNRDHQQAYHQKCSSEYTRIRRLRTGRR